MTNHWMFVGIFCALLVTSTSHGAPGGADRAVAWESRGPGGGGALFSPSINPHDGDELFMATDMGGVFHSRDFGRSWETLSFRTLQGGFNSQFRFTADPRVLYAINLLESPDGVGRSLVKSVDGGVTWTAPVTSPGTPGAAYFLFVDPHSTQRIVYTDAAHVFFSLFAHLGDASSSYRQDA